MQALPNAGVPPSRATAFLVGYRIWVYAVLLLLALAAIVMDRSEDGLRIVRMNAAAPSQPAQPASAAPDARPSPPAVR